MKNILYAYASVIAVSSLLQAGVVLGADLPSKKPPVVYTPVVAPFSWTGFYIGANAGGGFGVGDQVGLRHNGAELGNIGNLSPSGFVGGGQIGYNYQWQNFVVGLETDFQGASISSTVHNPILGRGSSARSKIDWFGTVRPRVGYAFDRFLIYATGGLAYADVDYRLSAARFGSFGKSETKVGGTVGGGIEYAITDNISAKLEYDFVGIKGYTLGNRNISTKPSPSFHVVRAGLNYKFSTW